MWTTNPRAPDPPNVQWRRVAVLLPFLGAGAGAAYVAVSAVTGVGLVLTGWGGGYCTRYLSLGERDVARPLSRRLRPDVALQLTIAAANGAARRARSYYLRLQVSLGVRRLHHTSWRTA